ncbi:MAG TPA: hypothetical protein VJS85_05880 [Rhizomicrobium sp.]|nr:hypothetical protein [Rhizomicrobium sp.]
MIGRFSAVLLAGIVMAWSATGAVAAEGWADRDIEAAKAFQKSLKNNQRGAIARMVSYPINRDFPLPPIKSPQEFLAHWDEYFDKANTAALLNSTPEEVGWRGIMLANGLVWFNNERVFALNLRTSLYQTRLEEVRRQEAATLYPSVRGYQKVEVTCSTKTKHIRIQEYRDGVRYFVWPKGASLSQEPELALRGEMQFDGSGGNAVYTFRNGAFRYEFYRVRICGTDCDDRLTVFRNEKSISNQVCR